MMLAVSYKKSLASVRGVYAPSPNNLLPLPFSLYFVVIQECFYNLLSSLVFLQNCNCWKCLITPVTMCFVVIQECFSSLFYDLLSFLIFLNNHTGYNVLCRYNILCRYSGVFLLVSAALIAAQSDQPTTISLAEKILLKIGKKSQSKIFSPK